MKRGELINKGVAGATTLLFLAAVRPDPTPRAIEWGVVALLMYEGLTWCVRYIREIRLAKKEVHCRKAIERNNQARKEDGQRLDEFWIVWPMKEVS